MLSGRRSLHVALSSLSGGKALTENLKSNSNKVQDTLDVTGLLIIFMEINVMLLQYVSFIITIQLIEKVSAYWKSTHQYESSFLPCRSDDKE